MENIKEKAIYFVGIGGIGMSALARYFSFEGFKIYGYDRIQTELTKKLEQENMNIIYEDNLANLPQKMEFAVFTPAISKNNFILQEIIRKNIPLYKRSEILEKISQNYKTIAVAGTHGKTTISGMITHLLFNSSVGCNAFLGGISKNFETNFIINKDRKDLLIVEADEYDRSFLKLNPYYSVITAIDADHLDIYGNHESLVNAFKEFATKTHKGGCLFIKNSVKLEMLLDCEIKTYSLNNLESDYYAWNIRVYQGSYYFDYHTPDKIYFDICLSYPGLHNIENAIVAMAVALKCGITEEELRNAMASFCGMKRRFDLIIKTDNTIFIDDYAHHPQEITTTITSLRHFFPNKRITGIFQPHLYSRTRDFQKEFVKSLELLDEIILLDIYPAREEPIEGIDSKLLFSQIQKMDKYYVSKEQLLELIPALNPQILLTIGAGDIDQLVNPIKKIIKEQI
ncbi:MAG: UDP-N-acetylmuramate--L-alanine ligase [Bacteroidales bacterium]|jgi:UDP-N-acetylmuramate--alanine ligase|nr:UDP-N-acetylmuramate--L-alanine ligase [Bacteroidales bacterium]